MGDLVGLTIVKKFTYRGDATEEWSNKYHLTGDIPSGSTAWKALADALITQEKACWPSTCFAIRAYGYDSDDASPSAVWSYDYLAHAASVAGTGSTSAGTVLPGDAAGVVWWKTDRLNSRGRPIYLRKYFHGLRLGADGDSVVTNYTSAYDAFATKLWDGTFLDGRTIRSRTHAETIVSSGHDPFVTTRTLKRRGKRP